MDERDIEGFLARYHSTLNIALEVDKNIDKNMFTDYEKKFAAFFFKRSKFLEDFILTNDNGKYTLKPKDGIINDPVLKAVYENCKGAIDYIETLVQSYYAIHQYASEESIDLYLKHFFIVTERNGYNISKGPLAYGDYRRNDSLAMYKLIANKSYPYDPEYSFNDEEIELVIALVSLREKLTKRGECDNYSTDGTYNDLFYPTFQEWTYHSDLVDSIIENYPDLMKKLDNIAHKTNNTDFYKVHGLLKNHKNKHLIEDIREAFKEEKDKYTSQLYKEIVNSNGRDFNAQDKLNKIILNDKSKEIEERKKQRLEEVNSNIGTIKTLLDDVRFKFNEYDVYMGQYIYNITDGDFNNLQKINPELYPHVQKPLEYLNCVYETIEKVDVTLTYDEIKYVFERLFRKLNMGQLLTAIVRVVEQNLRLSEPTIPKNVDPMKRYDLDYDPGRTVGVYELPAFSVLVKQNPNLIQIIEENGINRLSVGWYHYLIEQYMKGEFLDENETLKSYVNDELYQQYQDRCKKFLKFEQSNKELRDTDSIYPSSLFSGSGIRR